jgi:DNA-binding transcriptional MerR regulator
MVKIELYEEIFSLGEVAEILAIPETRVKNWTIGRPLKIRPLRAARGTGSRNLYGLHDMHRIAIANQLHKNGFRAEAIQKVLDALGKNFTTSFYMVIPAGDWTKNKAKLEVQLVDHAQFMKEGWLSIKRPIASSIGCFVLNIGSVINTVDVMAASFREGSPHEWQESKRRGKPRVQTHEDE